MKKILITLCILFLGQVSFAQQASTGQQDKIIDEPNKKEMGGAKESIGNSLPSSTAIIENNISNTKLNDPNNANYESFDGLNSYTLSSPVDSLFYSSEKTALLYGTIKKYKLSKGSVGSLITEEAEPTIDEQGKLNLPEVPEIVYSLNSILYPKDTIWSVWVNGIKHRKEDENVAYKDNFKIYEVNENSVTLVYESQQPIEYFSPNYKSLLKENYEDYNATQEDGHYYDYISKDHSIKVSSGDKVVKFKLSMGQTFSLNEMKIYDHGYEPKKTTDILEIIKTPNQEKSPESNAHDVSDNEKNLEKMLTVDSEKSSITNANFKPVSAPESQNSIKTNNSQNTTKPSVTAPVAPTSGPVMISSGDNNVNSNEATPPTSNVNTSTDIDNDPLLQPNK